MKVKIMKLTAGDIEEINPEVWAEGGKSGLLNIPPIEVKMQPGTPPIRIKQYPMSLEGKKGLIPIIEQLLKEGILEPCMSPHNTPILAVKKAEGKYRLVQDLREINKRTITKHPVVPNPYNLLSQIPQEHAWFTIIDLKDAFWACPLAEGSRDWFAFEWDHPETKRRQQLRWTRLPQGFTESPNLFGQALERLLEQFTPEGQVQILQYVDDLLISGENQLEVRTTSIKLLNFLGEKGLKVSKKKLQFVKPEVTYLGHLIGKGYKKLSPERIAGIIAIPAPKTKRDIRKLLGLFGYCRHWIDEYTQNVRFLYDKLVSPEPIEWTQEDEKQLEKLKNKLSTAPVLSLPDLKKEFDLFVNTEGGVAYGVLAQEWGGCKKPIAFLSKILDPVARGWPACLQAVAATAVLVEESQKLTLNGKIQIHTPHDIKTVLSREAPGWVTDSRILKYEITLINSENLRLTVSKNLNPAQFLSGEPPPDLEHDCLELMSLQTKVREDLESTPLPYGKRLFTDGSSRVLEGKRVSGYAVVEGSTIEDIQVRETGKLPSSWSAQLCEIYAVKRGLDLLGGDRGTIYTDSKYAFGIVHTFGKIWEERGYLNSKGKDLVHKEMIRSVLTSLLKPIEIAVVHVKGHQKETTFEGKGNQLADKEAKRAAQDPKGSIRILALNETSEEEGGEEKPKVNLEKRTQETRNKDMAEPSKTLRRRKNEKTKKDMECKMDVAFQELKKKMEALHESFTELQDTKQSELEGLRTHLEKNKGNKVEEIVWSVKSRLKKYLRQFSHGIRTLEENIEDWSETTEYELQRLRAELQKTQGKKEDESSNFCMETKVPQLSYRIQTLDPELQERWEFPNHELQFVTAGLENSQAVFSIVGEDEARKPCKYDCLDSENVKPVNEIELKMNNLVTAVVGFIEDTFQVTPNPDEVSEVFVEPLEYFVRPLNYKTFPYQASSGYLTRIHCFTYDDQERKRSFKIWGLTAHFAVFLALVIFGERPTFEVDYDLDNLISSSENNFINLYASICERKKSNL
ncbi:hypothetical protein DUI87_25780 [Hirundo rustica rustica]|uniref:ribonuclease H n=1 Tax=Hirundo rustica rustica TaxID=333673 RepID=A0A3M0JBZ0_HIRRU|nr:hypothetical protein DUI87_25780 [Hirundo rustica rustica]